MASSSLYSCLWLAVSLGLVTLHRAMLSVRSSTTNRQTALIETTTKQTVAFHANASLSVSDFTVSNNARPMRRLCQRHEIIDGQWIKQIVRNPPYVTNTVHLRCYTKSAYYSGSWKSWIWQPSASSCEFTNWNKEGFCNLMKSATVSIIGDSLSWEQYSSLIQLLGKQTQQGLQHHSRELNTNIVQTVCDGTKIVYRRDDHLEHIAESIDQHFPTVLILNRGAHYVTDDVLLPAIRNNIQQVRVWLQQCDIRDIKCHFFWRTSVPGHPGCGNYTEPVNDIEQMEAVVTDKRNYNHHTLKYHWYDYQHQNKLVEQELFQANLSSLEWIDAYYLNIRRPDQHRSHQDDCLHNCYPGKMDVYNQLVLHYLKQQRTSTDILQQTAESQHSWDLDDEDTVYDPQATEAARKIREAHVRKIRQAKNNVNKMNRKNHEEEDYDDMVRR